MVQVAKKRKKTALQKAYSKEVSRVKQAMKRLANRGYIVESPSFKDKPRTRDLERLKSIKTQQLIEKSQFIVPETGEVVSGLWGQKYENVRRSQKAAKTREHKKRHSTGIPPRAAPRIIQGFLSNIPYGKPEIFQHFHIWIRELIAMNGGGDEGEDKVAQMLLEGQDNIAISNYNLYDENERVAYMRELERFLPANSYSMYNQYAELRDSIEESEEEGWNVNWM